MSLPFDRSISVATWHFAFARYSLIFLCLLFYSFLLTTAVNCNFHTTI